MEDIETRIRWLDDLVRLEIVLWERVDRRLRAAHGMTLGQFEALDTLARGDRAGLRVGEIAERMRITVGGASKLVDRVEASGHLRRVADPDDRRASRAVLTPAGRKALRAARGTHAAEVAAAVDPTLNAEERRHLHDLVRRLLSAQ